jgi:citronellol/citronellal dehydrogenase
MKRIGRGHIITHAPPLHRLNDIVENGWLANNVGCISSKMGMHIVTAGIAAELTGHGVAATTIWPATAIESEAVYHLLPGPPFTWRSPDIITDMVREILRSTEWSVIN